MKGNCLTMDFLNARAQLDDRNYLLATIAYHAAPVYSGRKPSALINLGRPESRLAELWTKYREDIGNGKGPFSAKGLSFAVFYDRKGDMQAFCYDREHIGMVWSDSNIHAYLDGYGYRSSFGVEDCILVLQRRFFCGCPHEIGIFLGYPLPDVKAFILNSGKNYLLNGYWKVYSNVPNAIRTFEAFDQAKRNALREWV